MSDSSDDEQVEVEEKDINENQLQAESMLTSMLLGNIPQERLMTEFGKRRFEYN